MSNRVHKWLVFCLLTIIIVSGMLARLYPIGNWLEHKDRFFFNNKEVPLLVTVDGYFYLEAAQAVQQNTYNAVDPRRHVPVGHERSSVPPLLSVLLAGLNTLTGVSLEWLAILLPGVIGAFLAIPSWLICTVLLEKVRQPVWRKNRCLAAAPWAALVAACFTIFSPMYLERSALGWLDTDILNITLSLLLCFLGIKIADSKSDSEGVVALVIFGAVACVFAWWWDQSLTVVLALAGVPLAVALLFLLFRDRKRCLLLFTCLALCCVFIGWWKGWSTLNPKGHFQHIVNIYNYIQTDGGVSVFQPSGRTVSEQAGANFAVIVAKGFGGLPAFVIAGSFFLLLALLTQGYILFLAGIVLVGLLSFDGLRFIIFLAPVFGLGMGFAVYFVFCLVRQRWISLSILAAIIGIGGFGLVEPVKSLQWRVPRRLPVIFDAMRTIKAHSSEESVIWASWGHGHPLVYYSDRGVIADGMYHSAQLQYVLNYPLSVASDRLAANWISFYVARGPSGLRKINEQLGENSEDWGEGLAGLQKILAAGPVEGRKILDKEYGVNGTEGESILQFIFPTQQRPMFLLLDYLMLNQAWYPTGQWNVKLRKQPTRQHFISMDRVQLGKNGFLRARNLNNKVMIDIRKGRVDIAGDTIALRSLSVRAGDKMLRKRYKHSKGMVVYANLGGAVGMLGSQKVANALLPKLFFETAKSKYFTPVDKHMPFYSLWKVNGEKYHGEK
ncbi:STT3 domain-containing protein [Desulfogranum marinum]|uniref:STT3 domain-containing protein n=1 Tax=Desulfogranum marinum TaxID=453220 RepID=UPI001962B759|nr:STT3 domain-containing protein [Desulfogranum marinum]MBM9513569.1 hypothetical protein [Desulfogranum marinum]